MINLLRQRQTGHIIKLLLYIILGGGMAALPVVIGSMYLHSGMGHVYGVSCVYADSGGGPRGGGSGPVGAEDGRREARSLRNAWRARRLLRRAMIMTRR